MKVWAYDIETLINCFTVTFVNANDTSEYKQFVIHPLQNDTEALLEFAQKFDTDQFVSFNGENFDKPILFYLIDSARRNAGSSPELLCKSAYIQAQTIVSGERIRYSPKFVAKNQIDLFKIYHFDNEARRTSLKWIQCHLNMDSIQEMPYAHDSPVTTAQQIQGILKYNLNDVLATVKLYNHPSTKGLVELRDWAFDRYKIISDSKNISNAHMGELIFLKSLGNVQQPDTSNREIHIGKLIIPTIRFESKQFSKVLSHFKSKRFMTRDEDKGIGTSCVFDGLKYVFGLGGIHAARENSIHEDINTLDVKSFYPSVAIRYEFAPKHVSKVFVATYRKLFEDRVKAKSKTANAGLKEALNSVFGKSNSEFSLLYDPEFTFSITVNGQLLMAMLAERITLSGAGTVIMANTDGMEIKVKDKVLFEQVIQNWQEETKMTIEQGKYSKIMIMDVNNYIALSDEGKVKTKGVYEVDKDFHKDPSAKICAIAVRDWFCKGILIADTITSWKNRSDFFMYRRAKTGHFIGYTKSGEEVQIPKTIRYLMTKSSGLVLYQVTDAVKTKLHTDSVVTIVNDINDIPEDIEINYKWYIKESIKLIVEMKLDLFS